MQHAGFNSTAAHEIPLISVQEHGDSQVHVISAASWQNQQKNMGPQRRLRSAWAYTQSDQSFRCLHEESLGP